MSPTLTSPFVYSELRGVFTCSREFVDRLRAGTGNSRFFHAAHAHHVRQFYLADNEVTLRSHFEVQQDEEADDGITRLYDCFWASLHPWHEMPPRRHNHHGPLTVQLPLSRLIGMRFYVFKRMISGYGLRYYFVQRRTKLPMFGPDRKARAVDPARFFLKGDGGLRLRRDAQYELCLTESITLRKATIVAHAHERCVPRDCDEWPVTRQKSLEQLKAIAKERLAEMARQFPQLSIGQLAPSKTSIRVRIRRSRT